MLIRAYGLFWQADEVDWSPGAGTTLRLRGYRGHLHESRKTDFRYQQGIYILYDNYGPYYVGLVEKARGIGKRLCDHRTDRHQGKWSRFSWFGFRPVLEKKDEAGFHKLRTLPALAVGTPEKAIRDLEALLILTLGARGQNKMKFKQAAEWKQMMRDQE